MKTILPRIALCIGLLMSTQHKTQGMESADWVNTAEESISAIGAGVSFIVNTVLDYFTPAQAAMPCGGKCHSNTLACSKRQQQLYIISGMALAYLTAKFIPDNLKTKLYFGSAYLPSSRSVALTGFIAAGVYMYFTAEDVPSAALVPVDYFSNAPLCYPETEIMQCPYTHDD